MGTPIGVELPVERDHAGKVERAGDQGGYGERSDEAGDGVKPGARVVNVPLFIKEGEWIKIDTRNGAYLERVNK